MIHVQPKLYQTAGFFAHLVFSLGNYESTPLWISTFLRHDFSGFHRLRMLYVFATCTSVRSSFHPHQWETQWSAR